MRTARIALTATLALGLVLTGCKGNELEERVGTSRPLTDAPLSDEEVTLHLLEAPELPAALSAAEVTTSELRTEGLTERHTIELVDVPADVDQLEEALIPGAVLRVADGAQLEVLAAVSSAPLVTAPDAAGALGEVTGSCPAPCTVDGPAVVAPEGWLSGIGAEAGWLLLVPSPIG